MKYTSIAMILSVLILLVNDTYASRNRANNSEKKEVTVLVIGFGDNVASNYFPKVEIAEKLNVSLADFDSLLNEKFYNMFEGLNVRRVNFAIKPGIREINHLRSHIHFHGESGQVNATIHEKHKDYISSKLSEHNADYILIYNQYFLRWQEEPFNTLFHIFSYTVFDHHLNEVLNGQDHFNTFSLVPGNELKRNLERLVRRSTQNIARNL